MLVLVASAYSRDDIKTTNWRVVRDVLPCTGR